MSAALQHLERAARHHTQSHEYNQQNREVHNAKKRIRMAGMHANCANLPAEDLEALWEAGRRASCKYREKRQQAKLTQDMSECLEEPETEDLSEAAMRAEYLRKQCRDRRGAMGIFDPPLLISAIGTFCTFATNPHMPDISLLLASLEACAQALKDSDDESDASSIPSLESPTDSDSGILPRVFDIPLPPSFRSLPAERPQQLKLSPALINSLQHEELMRASRQDADNEADRAVDEVFLCAHYPALVVELLPAESDAENPVGRAELDTALRAVDPQGLNTRCRMSVAPFGSMVLMRPRHTKFIGMHLHGG
ncbi:hypothetical protein C8J57DRAFT_1251288 [Mycena rebaudengoi]|nr:hypothetical protein C8J57DRAFT_1251288 [Mycena rebaudengoi]